MWEGRSTRSLFRGVVSAGVGGMCRCEWGTRFWGGLGVRKKSTSEEKQGLCYVMWWWIFGRQDACPSGVLKN